MGERIAQQGGSSSPLREGPPRGAAPGEYHDVASRSSGRGVGRTADKPKQIPWDGWKQILKRLWSRTLENNTSMVAAGVAYFSLLALFPAIAALVSLYGLIADPAQVDQQFSAVSRFLPGDAYNLIAEQMRNLAARPAGALGLGFAGAIVLSIWSATRGTNSVITALNIAYDEDETRGFLRLTLLSFALTLFLVIIGILAIASVVALPVILGFVGLGALAETLVNLGRWPILAAVVLLALAVLYRYAPSRHEARWRWVTWGSGIAVGVWLIASGLFSFYVSRFGNFNATYGSIGAVIILLMWLYISAFVIILGAELNAEMERQTARDTTRGPDKPRGRRGAYVADNLPKSGDGA